MDIQRDFNRSYRQLVDADTKSSMHASGTIGDGFKQTQTLAHSPRASAEMIQIVVIGDTSNKIASHEANWQKSEN